MKYYNYEDYTNDEVRTIVFDLRNSDVIASLNASNFSSNFINFKPAIASDSCSFSNNDKSSALWTDRIRFFGVGGLTTVPDSADNLKMFRNSLNA
uniref:Uncharacterized protein n=1 Tax=Romanomermis culicivorax TaxID=13658 RepID=A0A915JSS9_ROMCU